MTASPITLTAMIRRSLIWSRVAWGSNGNRFDEVVLNGAEARHPPKCHERGGAPRIE
jgi:hypothetical protein